jgi:hypothetical protein
MYIMKKYFHTHRVLHVVAIPEASVREVEPTGEVLSQIRFIGKTYNPVSDDFDVVPCGVSVPYSSHIVQALKDKALLPANQETAHVAGVSFDPSALQQ